MIDIGSKQTSLSTLPCQINLLLPLELKALPFLIFMHLTHKTHIIHVYHVLNSFHTLKHFVANLSPPYTTQNSDLFVTHQEDFNMHTGQPNPQYKIKEYISGKIVLDFTTKHYVFPALNVSSNFATIDYDAQINT